MKIIGIVQLNQPNLICSASKYKDGEEIDLTSSPAATILEDGSVSIEPGKLFLEIGRIVIKP